VENGKVIGSITERRVLNTILDDPGLKDEPVTMAMNDPFPFVLPSTRIDVLSKMISKENPAVLVQSEDGKLDIITEYDLISVLAGNV
jgi:cystathionine beta-synthase